MTTENENPTPPELTDAQKKTILERRRQVRAWARSIVTDPIYAYRLAGRSDGMVLADRILRHVVAHALHGEGRQLLDADLWPIMENWMVVPFNNLPGRLANNVKTNALWTAATIRSHLHAVDSRTLRPTIATGDTVPLVDHSSVSATAIDRALVGW